MAALNDKYAPAVQAAVTFGKNLLNKYYNITDSSEVYRIAMSRSYFFPRLSLTNSPLLLVLHPSHKTTYFTLAGWDQDWIDTAKGIVRAEFDRAYADLELEDLSTVNSHVSAYLFFCF